MSLNKVQLIGNVGKDPDVRYLDNGVAVAAFTLATTDRGYTLANGTQKGKSVRVRMMTKTASNAMW